MAPGLSRGQISVYGLFCNVEHPLVEGDVGHAGRGVTLGSLWAMLWERR